MLTQEYVKSILLYDEETGKLSWRPGTYGYARNRDRHAGTFNNKGYRMIKLKGRGYMLHRVIWLYVVGSWPTQIDHIDQDRTNNRFSNLREAETWQNCHNQRARINNTSGYKGVQLHGDFFKSSISVKGKSIFLGVFSSAEEAYEVYKRAVAEHAKEFSPFENAGLAA